MGYRLINNQYQEIPITSNNHRWSEELQLYLGIEEGKLRYFAPSGELIPTPQEIALREKAKVLQEKAIAQQTTTLAEREKQRADTLANYLRSLGINPEQIIS